MGEVAGGADWTVEEKEKVVVMVADWVVVGMVGVGGG